MAGEELGVFAGPEEGGDARKLDGPGPITAQVAAVGLKAVAADPLGTTEGARIDALGYIGDVSMSLVMERLENLAVRYPTRFAALVLPSDAQCSLGLANLLAFMAERGNYKVSAQKDLRRLRATLCEHVASHANMSTLRAVAGGKYFSADGLARSDSDDPEQMALPVGG